MQHRPSTQDISTGRAFLAGPLEQLLPLTEAAQLLPRQPHISTLFRWRTRGVRGHRLRTVSVGRVPCTTRQWLLEFFEQVDASRSATNPSPGGCQGNSKDTPSKVIRGSSRKIVRKNFRGRGRGAREILGLDRLESGP